MNKEELLQAMKDKVEGGSKAQAEKYLKAFIDTVTEALVKGEKVQLIGFGTFEVVDRKAHVGRNPKTNEEIPIPAKKAPKFKVGKQLKDAVEGK